MKTCKKCGAPNHDSAVKCSTCNCDFIVDTMDDNIEYQKYPIWTFISLGVSLLLLIVYSIYIQITKDFQFAIVIYPLLGSAVIIIGYYWFNLYLENKKALRKKAAMENAVNSLDDSADIKKHTTLSFKQILCEKAEQSKEIVQGRFDNNMNAEMAVEILNSGEKFPDKNCAQQLIAAFSSRRSVILCVSNEDEIVGVQNALSVLTGINPLCIQFANGCSAPNDFYVCEDENRIYPSELLSELFAAEKKMPAIVPVLISSSYAEIDKALYDLENYLVLPFEDGVVRIKNIDKQYINATSDELVKLSRNVRLVFVATLDQIYNLPSSFVHKCAVIDFKAQNLPATEIKNGVLSFLRLSNLFGTSAEEYYLSEDHWKKIDGLVDFINEVADFSIDNRLAVAMENFVCVYMASGADELQALDAVLSVLVLPSALSAFNQSKVEDKPSVSQYMDTQFGLENLSMCSEVLKKFTKA